MELRTCRQCGQTKTIVSFQSRGNGARRTTCRKCRRGSPRLAVPPLPVEGSANGIRTCKICGEDKPLVKFSPTGQGRRRQICRKCKDAGGYKLKSGLNHIRLQGSTPDSRICYSCMVEKPIGEFVLRIKVPTYQCVQCFGHPRICRGCTKPPVGEKDYCDACRIKGLKRQKQWHRKLRAIVIDAYGGKCHYCQNNELIFLTIDHINNDGNQHRKTIRGSRIYQWLYHNNYPTGFQVLCWNCNSAKHIHGEEAVKAAIARIRAIQPSTAMTIAKPSDHS